MTYLFRLSCIIFFLSFIYLTPLSAQGTDTIPPQLKCRNYYVANACYSTGYGQLQAYQLVDSVTDNTSLTSDIRLGIRKKCTGNGFPENHQSLTFTVAELGIAYVEVWAKDAAGNTTSCQVQVEVVDPPSYCDAFVDLYAHSPKDFQTNIWGIAADLQKISCNGDTTRLATKTPYNEMRGFSRPGDLLTVTPFKQGEALNGVSTYDLVMISKHILGLYALSPYQLVAADANQDGKVTTYDIVLLRQLILGIITELPNKACWRFIPYEYELDNDNPFSVPFPEYIEVPRSAELVQNQFHFLGIKIGDLDYSADLK